MGDRNVVLVTIDSLRADHCGFLAEGMDTTPTLDALADGGVVFEDAIAPGPRTPSSMPALFTGARLPVREHAGDDGDLSARLGWIGRHLADHPTIAERFSERGYATIGITGNPYTNRETNFDAGVDTFLDLMTEAKDDYVDPFPGLFANVALNYLRDWWHGRGFALQWPTYLQRLEEHLSTLQEPYFLWLFLMDPHSPYIPPRQNREAVSTLGTYYGLVRGTSLIDHSERSFLKEDMPPHIGERLHGAYTDSVRGVDQFVGELLDRLEPHDPLVAVHADHGEAFGDHGRYGHQPSLYEENIHVPFLLANTEQTARLRGPLDLINLPEILLAYAEGTDPDPASWLTEYAVSTTEHGDRIAVRDDRYKFISTPDRTAVYDLAIDPDETDNIATTFEDLARLAAVADDHLEAREPATPTAPADVDTARVERQLEDLGYID